MNPIRLILVDDDAAFLIAVTEYLKLYEELLILGPAHGGRRGLAVAHDMRPDLVLLDLRNPNLSGLEVLPLLRATLPQAGLIVVTADDSEACRSAALAAGADAFVSKLAVGTDLLPAIRRVAQEHAYWKERR